MVKKEKTRGPVIDDKAQAEGALAEMAALERKIALSRLAMQESIDLAKERSQEECTPLERRHKELFNGVKSWAKRNKASMFDKKRSLDLVFGVIGFQGSTKIQQMSGMSEEYTLEKLKGYGFKAGIRITEKVDKEAMEKWTDERLALVGLIRRTSDNYYCKIKQENS